MHFMKCDLFSRPYTVETWQDIQFSAGSLAKHVYVMWQCRFCVTFVVNKMYSLKTDFRKLSKTSWSLGKDHFCLLIIFKDLHKNATRTPFYISSQQKLLIYINVLKSTFPGSNISLSNQKSRTEIESR